MSDLGFSMERGAHRPPKRSRRGAWVALALVLIVAAAVAAGVLLLRPPADYSGEGSGSVAVSIPAGASLTQIADTLVADDVIANAGPFIDIATASGASIAPGTYQMRRQMGPDAAFRLMQDPESRTGSRIVVKEGMRLKEIVAESSRVSGIPESEFTAALGRPDDIGLPAAAGGNPEGWLFPATYDVAPGATAEGILGQMTARFEQEAADIDLDGRAKALGRTPEEVVTIASILEVEGAPADFAKVSRVIENRLAAGMRLQLDSTVNYALGTRDLALSAAQLKVDSPYNTYLVAGLPPGPINSPGTAALEAALSPAPGPWLYFVTTDPATKTTKFATTYPEFLRLKAEYQRAAP